MHFWVNVLPSWYIFPNTPCRYELKWIICWHYGDGQFCLSQISMFLVGVVSGDRHNVQLTSCNFCQVRELTHTSSWSRSVSSRTYCIYAHKDCKENRAIAADFVQHLHVSLFWDGVQTRNWLQLSQRRSHKPHKSWDRELKKCFSPLQHDTGVDRECVSEGVLYLPLRVFPLKSSYLDIQ